ncbi:hypothetical protein BC831DRAFT_469260 [Entophlyctis helioformis]|nr:hypothetical protein BC831DRAFT_469260 [Entophlyctis helioformis]
MPFNALDLFALQCMALYIAFSVILLVRTLRIPTSLYILGIRTSIVLGIAAASIFVLAWAAWPHDSRGDRLLQRLASAITMAMITIFFWTQLEFLKVVAPYVASLSSRAILAAQTTVSVIGLVMFAAQMSLLVVVESVSVELVITGWGLIVVVYDLAQQWFMCYFILYKLKATPLGLRAKYITLMVLCTLTLVADPLILVLTTEDDVSLRLIWHAIVFWYGLGTIECLMVVHQALQSPHQRRIETDVMAERWHAHRQLPIHQDLVTIIRADGP